MVEVLIFDGDLRSEISDNISDQYEGLLQAVLIEYFPKKEITLCYLFNFKKQDINKVFKLDWLKEKAVNFFDAGQTLLNVTKQNYFLSVNNDKAGASPQLKEIYISDTGTDDTNQLFQKIESILDYRNISKEYTVLNRYGIETSKSRTVRKYSIRIDQRYCSESVDFDSLEEIKEILKNEYHAKRLVPISYTPWDSIETHEDQACEIDDLTILYLYEMKSFEVRVY